MLEPTFRPLITIIRLTPDRSLVEVSLDMDGHTVTGFGEITDDDSLSAACRGAVEAVKSLLPDHIAITAEWCLRVLRPTGPDVINSAVSLTIGPDGQKEDLIGAAYVRHDADVAAVRATLDGLTRRLAAHLLH